MNFVVAPLPVLETDLFGRLLGLVAGRRANAAALSDSSEHLYMCASHFDHLHLEILGVGQFRLKALDSTRIAVLLAEKD